MIPPMVFVIFHLKLSIERKTKINIKKSIEIEHAAPLLDTPKGFWFTAVHNIQGNGNPTVTSKMLEPTDDDTAISPFPCFATKTLVIKSGTDVPAAKKVNPITAGGMLAVSPATVAHHTIK